MHTFKTPFILFDHPWRCFWNTPIKKNNNGDTSSPKWCYKPTWWHKCLFCRLLCRLSSEGDLYAGQLYLLLHRWVQQRLKRHQIIGEIVRLLWKLRGNAGRKWMSSASQQLIRGPLINKLHFLFLRDSGDYQKDTVLVILIYKPSWPGKKTDLLFVSAIK